MPSPEPKGMPRLSGLLTPYRLFIRPFLFRFDAETIHHVVTGVARIFWSLSFGRRATRAVFMRGLRPLPTTLATLELASPIGLAAGFDKNALLVPGIENLGFGFVEIGTVTPRPQLGNPRPRLSRIPDRRALLNRMGFNNDGAEIIADQLAHARGKIGVPVGVNLGKNRDTPNSEAIGDYEVLFKAFQASASYFTINISSPNTPGLRDLQNAEFVRKLGERVQALGVAQPVFVKLAPDVAEAELKEICGLCGFGRPFAGLVLTNTIGTDLGGISGFPVKSPSTALLKVARAHLAAPTPIISVGGIESADDVIERFKLGASAVQLYSSLIYGGPGHVGRILRTLQKKMKRSGVHRLTDFRSH